MSEPKENFLISLIKFIMSNLKTGNEKLDKGIGSLMLFCILSTIIMFVLSMFLWQVSETMPEIARPLGAFLGALVDWFGSLISVSAAPATDVIQLPVSVPELPAVN